MLTRLTVNILQYKKNTESCCTPEAVMSIILQFFFKVQYTPIDLSAYNVHGHGFRFQIETTFKKHHLS